MLGRLGERLHGAEGPTGDGDPEQRGHPDPEHGDDQQGPPQLGQPVLEGIEGTEGGSAYNASKGGVVILTKNIALDYGRKGIRANCVCPGVILTDAIMINTSEAEREAMLRSTPSSRHGSEEDVASLVSFLLSDEEAGWINGQAVNLNGGGLMAV